MAKPKKAAAPPVEDEEQMRLAYNSAVLMRHDPYMASLIATSAICNVYKFNLDDGQWDKLDYQGTLFVYSRAARDPSNPGDSHKFPYGLMVLNRHGPDNFSLGIMPHSVAKAAGETEMGARLEDSFIMVQTDDSAMYGLWLFSEKDREHIFSMIDWCLKEGGGAQ